MPITFVDIIEVGGTFAFAISGIRLASGKQIDWFGAYIIGLVTAIGGGTIRDILLDITPFWMLDASYFTTTGVALLATLVFKQKVFKWGTTLFIFDTIGLALFTMVGISKSLQAGFPVWVCVIMGTITGSAGGVIRDILLNEVPLLFRKDVYALTCVVGGLIFFGMTALNIAPAWAALAGALAIIASRVAAIRWHISLPRL